MCRPKKIINAPPTLARTGAKLINSRPRAENVIPNRIKTVENPMTNAIPCRNEFASDCLYVTDES